MTSTHRIMAAVPSGALVTLLACSAVFGLAFSESYSPGDVIASTERDYVQSALGNILQIGTQGRLCAVGVACLDANTELHSPEVYLYSGSTYGDLPASIPHEHAGLALFHKKDYATYGTAGVLTYLIRGTNYKVAIMWEVPWNSVMYDEIFNVKIYHKNIRTNKDMFKQMVNYAGSFETGQSFEREEYGIRVSGAMTGDYESTLFVTVDAANYDWHLGPDLYSACSYNAAWFSSYCWQECSPNGYCWVDKRCGSDSECEGHLQCYAPCKKWSD